MGISLPNPENCSKWDHTIAATIRQSSTPGDLTNKNRVYNLKRRKTVAAAVNVVVMARSGIVAWTF